MLKYTVTNIVFTFSVAALGFIRLTHPFPWWIYGVLAVGYLAINAYGAAVLSARFFVPTLFKGSSADNTIAITFDDGPVPENTDRILSILKKYEVPAAFFCIGNRVNAHPDIVRKVHDAGHLVANHSYWHRPTFDLQSAAKVVDELQKTNDAIQHAVGKTPRFFRPPYGVTNPMVASAITEGSFATIGWSVRSFDTISKDADQLFKRVTKSLRSGDVILFHDYCDITINVLPRVIEYARQRGLKFVRVDELLNEDAYVAE